MMILRGKLNIGLSLSYIGYKGVFHDSLTLIISPETWSLWQSQNHLTQLQGRNPSEKASGRIAHWSTYISNGSCTFSTYHVFEHWSGPDKICIPRFHRLCREYREHCKGISLQTTALQNTRACIGRKEKGGFSMTILGDLERTFRERRPAVITTAWSVPQD